MQSLGREGLSFNYKILGIINKLVINTNGQAKACPEYS